MNAPMVAGDAEINVCAKTIKGDKYAVKIGSEATTLKLKYVFFLF